MNGGIIALATPAYALAMGLELAVALWAQRRRGRPLGFSFGDVISNLSCGIGSQIFVAINALQGVFFYHLAEQQLGRYHGWQDSLSGWALGLLLVDLCWYFYHWASHRVNLLWATHAVHHQSPQYNLTVSLRLSWFSGVFSWLFYLPLALLGMPLLMQVMLRTVHSFYQFVLHTRLVGRLGGLEWLLNTPSHHRVHHARDAHYRDHNYGGIFILWDRLFGTFMPERDEPHYGTEPPHHGLDPLWANLVEWVRLGALIRRAPGWRDKLRAPLMPPEWQPAGWPARPATSEAESRRAPPDLATALYICAHFATVLVGSTALMLYEARLSALGFATAVIELIWPMCVWAALLARRRLALWLELSRLFSLGLVAAFALRAQPGLGPLPLSGAVLLALGASLLWLSQLPLAARPSPALPPSLRRPEQARADRRAALAILIALVLYAGYKQREHMLGDLLFGCHAAALVTALGLAANARRWVSLGLVFALGLGLPMWLILVASTGTTNVLSVILHLLPPWAALRYVRRQGLAPRAWLWAWGLFLALLPISYFFSDPALNVNLVHRPSPELAYFVPSVWGARLYGCSLAGVLLLSADFVLARTGPPTARLPRGG